MTNSRIPSRNQAQNEIRHSLTSVLTPKQKNASQRALLLHMKLDVLLVLSVKS